MVGAACGKAGRRERSWCGLLALFGTAGQGTQARADHARPRRSDLICGPLAFCAQELQELERKLEDKLAHQEAVQLQRALASRQQWAGDEPGLLAEPEDADSGRQVSAVLQQALSQGRKLLERQQQR